MTPRGDREDAVALVVGERDRVVREEPDEIRQEPSGNDDAGIAVELSARDDARSEISMSVAASVSRPVLGLEEDPAEHLHGATRRDRAGDDAERLSEIALRAGDAKRGAGGYVCVHY